MKRLCVAGLFTREVQGFEPPRSRYTIKQILLGRRGKEPNRGLFVLPGGGVEEGESLDAAFLREMREEIGLDVPRDAHRWSQPKLLELPDRIILVAQYPLSHKTVLEAGSDLYDLRWFPMDALPSDLSPVIAPLLHDRF